MKTPAPRVVPELRIRWGNRFAMSRNLPTHSHVETELVAVTKGRCQIWVGEQSLEGGRGTIFVLPATVPQNQWTTTIAGTTCLGFDNPPGFFDERARALVFDLRDPALQWVEHLCDSCLSQPALSGEVSRPLLTALLRRIEDVDAITGSLARLHPAVRAARKWLETHLCEPVTLGSLARGVGISASHLSALFAAQCGTGPMRYLQRLRMERSCSLLADPYLRIQQVAQASGYADVNYFTRLFRRTMGMSPGRWRNESGCRSPGGIRH